MPKYRYTRDSLVQINPAEHDPAGLAKDYQAFMESYVARINKATFNVTIGGVRVGNARYSRLAQINLRTRVITFSHYAIKKVPERGRRYLVLHELAHLYEAGHNRRFWKLVARYEPDYRRIGRAIQQSFTRNVKAAQPRAGASQLSLVNHTSILLLPEFSNYSRLELEHDNDGILPGGGIIAGGSADNETCFEDIY